MLKIKGIELIFDQGTAPYQEDGFIIDTPFFGVVDGFSAPHNKKVRQILFKGMSGGEMVRQITQETFHSKRADWSLKRLILKANQRIAKIQTNRGIAIDRSDLLAGASFVIVKIEPRGKTIEIIQVGDCFAVCVYKSGKIGVTRNQALKATSELLPIIADLMKKHGFNRDEMLIEFFPILSNQRLRDTNIKTETGYAVLNGQLALKKHWQELTIPLAGIELLLLFTDGFIPCKKYAKEKTIAKKIVALYQKNGLKGILDRVRSTEKSQDKKRHIAHSEATALAIKFQK